MQAASRTCGRSPSRSGGAPEAIVAGPDWTGLRRPRARKPERLIVPRDPGLADLDDARRRASRRSSRSLRELGVRLLRAERTTLSVARARRRRCKRGVPTRLPAGRTAGRTRNLSISTGRRQRAGEAVLARAEAMSVDDYRAALLAREAARRRTPPSPHSADAIITLSCPGPAHVWSATSRGRRWPRAPPASPCSTSRVRCCSRPP